MTMNKCYSVILFLLFKFWSIQSVTGYSPTAAPRFRVPGRTGAAVPSNILKQPLNCPSKMARRQFSQDHPFSLWKSDMMAMSTATVDDLEEQESASKSARITGASLLSIISLFKEKISKYTGTAANEDGLTLRQRLTKMGVFAAMSYNVVSQVNSGSSMSIAWYLFSFRVSRQTVEYMFEVSSAGPDAISLLSTIMIRRDCLLWPLVNGKGSWRSMQGFG